ncbi:hypothetical protein XFUD_07995 [Xylella fastidiosa]|uniref:Topo IA-type catalytic domain-containing protein n=1 Tax=Xylella fastidiosa (strain 9a5c) TaxID=160492 RepID=Q9PCD6_XYLFA|nr:hypothetical protein XF_1845 [Xylella fastidiosa 9a5c]ALQ95103.1 hypothetical protein XFUD_07995 [Xylella fastidiosa]
MRDREIEAFKSIPYHTIRAAFKHEGGVFVAVWRAKEDQVGLDPEGRLVDTVIANTLVESITGHIGKVIEYKQEPKKKAQPRAYSLSDMTLLASNKFGYSAADVLEVCQSLYETHKLIVGTCRNHNYLITATIATVDSISNLMGMTITWTSWHGNSTTAIRF